MAGVLLAGHKGLFIMRRETFKNADYPNAKPLWQKARGYGKPLPKTPKTQIEKVLEKLDWEKLALIGKEKIFETNYYKNTGRI